MVLLIRDNECFEPRTQNYIEYFNRNGIAYHVIGWNRNGTAPSSSNFSFFQKPAKYGLEKANIPNKILWMLYVFKEILIHRKDISLIHACDYDSIFPAIVLCKIFKKKVLFDVYDWISASDGSSPLYRTIEWLENFCYDHSDYVIICDEDRLKQAKRSRKDTYILPNIPNITITLDSALSEQIFTSNQGKTLTLSYVGVFDKHRGLENLLSCVASIPNVHLNIAGFGQLEDYVQDYASRFENITYWGRVDYPTAQTIMKCSDFIVAMYYLSNPVHKFAAPNKYFESLILSVPLITTTNTALGDKVSRHGTGITIGESRDDLLRVLNSPPSNTILEKMRKNCDALWLEKYNGFYDKFMSEKYISMLRR